MRSVFVHLRYATQREVAAFLDRTYPFQPGPPWILENRGDPVLYIEFYLDLNQEFEVETYLALLDHLGGEPAVSVVADVSGRHDGATEVRSFVCAMLGAFSGVAQDDYSDCWWNLEQVQNDETLQGHRFFDYKR